MKNKTGNNEERAYRVALYGVEGIGPHRFPLLIKYFGSAKKAWSAPVKELQEIGLPKAAIENLLQRRQGMTPRVYFRELKKQGVGLYFFGEKDYPVRLAEINNPPQILYVKGKILPEDELALAIVGTRRITPYGRQITENLTQDLVAQGLTIVSGMARGVDSTAHKAALQMGGRTIAVLGCGLDICYPPENKGLMEEIVKHGAVVSEFPLGYPALRQNFPARNRIISGLSLGVLVTEGAEKSGTKITAKWAADQGREVFAVPGPITSKMSQGPADLIKLGAKLVANVNDILEELNLETRKGQQKAKKVLPESPLEEKILAVLSETPIHIDEIVRQTGLLTTKVSSALSLMEMKGKVRNLGGMLYVIKR